MHRLRVLIGLILSLALAGNALAGFVYETRSEFLTSADVNGDGTLDALVLDRATGNVRVGYQAVSGVLTWSAPLPTGVANATGFATGRFLANDREAIAITAPALNRVHMLDVSDPAAPASPVTFAPIASGPSLLIGLRAPQGTEGTYDAVWTSSNQHDPGRTWMEVFEFWGEGFDIIMHAVSEVDSLEKGNALRLGNSTRTYAAAIARGPSDAFLVHMVTNDSVMFLARSNLPPQTDYVFGRFNNETYPRFLFYVPGESNITVQSLTAASGNLTFDAATVNPFTAPVQQVFYIDEGSNGLAVIHFGDGIVGARLPTDSNMLQVEYSFSATGNTATAVLPLGNGRFALLSGAVGSSETAQVYTKNGANYTETSTGSLPRVTSNGTRANVWLFATEPFVNANPMFVSSLNAGDWIASLTGLPGSLTVVAETDRGTSSGLGNPASQTLSAPPNTVQFGIANQYHPAMSLFSYSTPRAPEPVLVRIAPPPGHYDSGINISFTTSNASDLVFYRLGSAGFFRQYTAPFEISSNASIHYYGTASSGQRSSTQTASYTFTDNAFPQLVTTNGTGTNNIPPGGTISTSGIPVYAYGTVVYSRRAGMDGEVWMVNVDGTSDRYVTRGSRPRLSPDGRHLAFLREGDPFATIPYNNGNIWVRDLLTGSESRLISHTNLIFWFDWGYRTNLYFDHGCGLFVTDLSGNVTRVSAANDCNDEAPVVNPIDGTLAFHNVSGVGDARSGLFITDAGLTSKIRVAGAPVPHWPSWAPDGRRLAFAGYSYTYIPEGGMDLYVGHANGGHIHQITGFQHGSGFRHGAVWAPASDVLVGAGTIFGTNGIWAVPLSADGTHCEGEPWLIPVTPGGDPDFVGNVYVPPPSPRLFIRREGADAVIFWRRTAWPYSLQASGALEATIWNSIPGPFQVAGQNYEYRVPADSTRFYRLRLP